MTDSELHLPHFWVFVTFEDGHKLNVANKDMLAEEEAEAYAEYWNNHNNGHGLVAKVTLEDHHNRVAVLYTPSGKLREKTSFPESEG